MAHIVEVLCTDYIIDKVAVIAKDIHTAHRVMLFLTLMVDH